MHSREMPLFPYLPVIVWMGMIKVMLGATHDHDAQSMTEPADLTMNRASSALILDWHFRPRHFG